MVVCILNYVVGKQARTACPLVRTSGTFVPTAGTVAHHSSLGTKYKVTKYIFGSKFAPKGRQIQIHTLKFEYLRLL